MSKSTMKPTVSLSGGTPAKPAAECCLHHRLLTVKEIKQRNCLGKQCWHLCKNEDHAYWKQRELTKQKRKNRKAELESRFEMYTHKGVVE